MWKRQALVTIVTVFNLTGSMSDCIDSKGIQTGADASTINGQASSAATMGTSRECAKRRCLLPHQVPALLRGGTYAQSDTPFPILS